MWEEWDAEVKNLCLLGEGRKRFSGWRFVFVGEWIRAGNFAYSELLLELCRIVPQRWTWVQVLLDIVVGLDLITLLLIV